MPYVPLNPPVLDLQHGYGLERTVADSTDYGRIRNVRWASFWGAPHTIHKTNILQGVNFMRRFLNVISQAILLQKISEL